MPMDPELNFNWRLPALGDVADVPAAFRNFADDLADDLTLSGSLPYTPTWNTVPGTAVPGVPTNQPTGTLSRKGVYSIEAFSGICHFTAELVFGSAVYGAYGGLKINVPVMGLATIRQQLVPCMLTAGAAPIWVGVAVIDGGTFDCRPHFPISTARADLLPWTSTGSVYTNGAIPAVDVNNPGASNIVPNGSLVVSGSYRYN